MQDIKQKYNGFLQTKTKKTLTTRYLNEKKSPQFQRRGNRTLITITRCLALVRVLRTAITDLIKVEESAAANG